MPAIDTAQIYNLAFCAQPSPALWHCRSRAEDIPWLLLKFIARCRLRRLRSLRALRRRCCQITAPATNQRVQIVVSVAVECSLMGQFLIPACDLRKAGFVNPECLGTMAASRSLKTGPVAGSRLCKLGSAHRN